MPVDVLARRLRVSEHLPQSMSVAAMSVDDARSGGGREWTSEQRAAIERRHGDLLLDAGAGSGKTSVLVERFVRTVLEDGVDVTAILAITFTEKAAAELRDRIRARLRELGAGEAARRTEGAFISTIHGFCARVLRGHALAAGLDPDFRVLDRDRSEPLAAAAFEAALTALAQADAGAVELIAAYTVPTLRFATLSVYGQLRSAGALAPRLPVVGLAGLAGGGEDVDAAGELAEAAGAVARELAEAAGVLARELGAVADPGVRVIDALERVQRAIAVAADGPGAVWPAALYRLRLPKNGATLSTDACVAYSEALERFHVASGAAAARPVRDLLDRLLAGFGTEYERRKRDVSGLDFEDLELRCSALLAGDGELRERYAQRFHSIMVDELQDTNPVQLALIESIARDNLFTVGDAQQSIYGFRHADVTLFTARGERLARLGARETLRTNFRSRPEILEALNRAFATELGESFIRLEPGRPARALAAGSPAAGAPAVELLVVDKGADWELEGMAAPWRLAEARTLADRVAELVAAGIAPADVVVLMRATTDMRAYERALEARGLPTYVIGGRGYWAHPQVVDLVAYLSTLANPRDEEALYGVLASPLVGISYDALVLLGAAARAGERDPWSVLREPAEALAGLAADDRARLAAFARWFVAERERSARAGIEELIDGALAATGYDVAMLAMPGGVRRLANVRKLMRLAREHEAEHGPDLRGFVSVLADRVAGRSGAGDTVREGEAPVEGEGLDAIRLMTIHRAKGLEFEVVCVADLGRSPRPPSEIVRVGADGRLGLRLARTGEPGRESALDYGALGEEARAAAEREERRLFYVAMTRAREHLVLSGAAKFEGWLQDGKPTGGGPIAWIAPAFVPGLRDVIEAGGGEAQADGTRIAVRVGRPEDVAEVAAAHRTPPDGAPAAVASVAGTLPAAAGAVTAPPDGAPGAVAPVAGPPPAAPGPAVTTLSYSALGEYERCGYRFYTERVLGLPRVEEPAATGRERSHRSDGPRSAADRGVLVHALLEQLDFRRPAPSPATAIVAAAARAGLNPPPGPEECDELIALVRRFADTDLCQRLGRATDVRREQRFAFPLTPADALGGDVLIVGALDVIAREPGPGPRRLLIVDYKSDRLAGADPAGIVARSYETQRSVYALAALHAGAAEVEIAHCFLEAPERPVLASYAAGRRDELQARLRALAGGVLERRFDVTPAPCRSVCAGCPAEGGLCSWPLSQTRRDAADTLF